MKEEFKELAKFLKNYEGEQITIMEICGSHTGALTKSGIRGILSDKIKMISGPGCPVCVTPGSYIDKLIELAKVPGNVIATFGDMLRVPGSEKSLSQIKGEGYDIRMVYSPMELIKMAGEEPDKTFIFAAVGFETTAPVYALLLEDLEDSGIENVKLLTALKTMPPVVDSLCRENNEIDGFLAPGHVCAVTGTKIFDKLAEKYNIPFVAAGFKPEELVAAIAMLIKLKGQGTVYNCYKNVVTQNGNALAQEKVAKYFTSSDSYWRGMGVIKESGLVLKEEYLKYDAGSYNQQSDVLHNTACKCGEVLMGRIKPSDCPLFGKVCTPATPQGACMVSEEGACCNFYRN